MKYKGQISFHIEMGGGAWIQFHDDRGLHGDKNQYWNWAWTLNFNHKTQPLQIKIFKPDGEVFYEGQWTFDRHRYVGDYVHYPLEFTIEQLRECCDGQYKCEIETDELVDALKEKKDD